MNKYLKVTIIDENGEEETHNRVSNINFFKNYSVFNLLFKVEKLTDQEFNETK